MQRLNKFQLIILCSTFLLALTIVFHTFFANDGWHHRQKIREELQQLEEENIRLQTQIDSLKQEVSALRTNPAYQKRIIRKELGFVKKNDII